MQITQITAGWTETCSLPGYDNVKPGITLTATLELDDNPTGCMQLLIEQAQREVQELVNQAQENAGLYPKYYDGPKFAIYKSTPRKTFIVICLFDGNPPDDFKSIGVEGRQNAMLKKAGDLAINREDGWRAFNCTNNDFSMLPPLPENNTPQPQFTEDIPF